MASSYIPSEDDLKNFGVAVLVAGSAFAAFYDAQTISAAVFYVASAGLVLLTREFGFRTCAQWMDAYVENKVAEGGAVASVLGAIFAVLTGLPFILLFPMYNSASAKKYEQWGKSTDSVWMLRNYWLRTYAVVALIIGWALTYSFDSMILAQMYALTAFFYMLPIDYSGLPVGELDGAYILRWSSFSWLIMMGSTLVMYSLSV